MKQDVEDLTLTPRGRKRISWAAQDMPVLTALGARFEKQRPLKGVTVAACLHVTAESANLVRVLQSGGAKVVLCASNPLSTQNDVAAALVEDRSVPVFARRGESNELYYKHIESALDQKPNLMFDDGGDLVTTLLKKREQLAPNIIASLEGTTTGVHRLRAMARKRMLKFPVVAVNNADTKYLFDNRYGAGQSTVDAIVRATGMLVAGRTVVVAGYGMGGRGVAQRMRGMGANVVVTEVDPLKALEAAMDGYRVMSMAAAAPIGDLFITITGNSDVLRSEHFEKMKHGAYLANSGHFNVEINIDELSELAADIIRDVNSNVDEFVLEDGRSIYLLGEGRLINLAAAEGQPACVMDMSFSLQALMAEYAVKNRERLKPRIHNVPKEIDREVARLKLETMGVTVDELTPRQKKYLSSWELGT